MAKLTDEQVKHVAKLANLTLNNEEVKKYAEQLSAVLEYIDQLNTIETSNVDPTFNVSGQVNVFQPDETMVGLSQQDTLSNAKDTKDNQFVVKRIIGGE